MYVVIAFPDREFALHMFTVIILKAAVYVFFSICVYNWGSYSEQSSNITRIHNPHYMSICVIYSNIPLLKVNLTYSSYVTQLSMVGIQATGYKLTQLVCTDY